MADTRGFNLQQLNDLRLTLARKANRRLRALEKANLDYYAYDVATLYTRQTRNSNRFSEKKNMYTNIEAVLNEISRIEQFLNSKSSTVKGQRDIQRRREQAFKDKGYDMSGMTPRQLTNFFESSAFKNAKGVSSDFLVDYFLRGLEEGVEEETLYKALEEFNESETQGADELFNEVGLSILDAKV